MNDTFLTVTLGLIFIVGPFWLIYKMDRRATKKGALFTGPATRDRWGHRPQRIGPSYKRFKWQPDIIFG
jgi:hypothetical protein